MGYSPLSEMGKAAIQTTAATISVTAEKKKLLFCQKGNSTGASALLYTALHSNGINEHADEKDISSAMGKEAWIC